jgi:hypothetical protein
MKQAKYLSITFRSNFVLGYFFLVIFFLGCSENSTFPQTEKPQLSFPEFFVEKGNDIDTSYISLRGIKISEDSLKIEAVSWGVIEFGLHLMCSKTETEFEYVLMGECGTTLTKTYQKVTLSDWITAEESENLLRISFSNFRDTVEVIKAGTH